MNKLLLDYFEFVKESRYYKDDRHIVYLSICGIGFSEEFFELLESIQEYQTDNNIDRIHEEMGGFLWKTATLCEVFGFEFDSFVLDINPQKEIDESKFVSILSLYLGNTKKIIRSFYCNEKDILNHKEKISNIKSCMEYMFLYSFQKIQNLKIDVSFLGLIKDSIVYNIDQLKSKYQK